MYEIKLNDGKSDFAPKGGMFGKINSKVNKFFNVIFEEWREKNRGPIIMTTAMSQYWDPITEEKRVLLMEHLAGPSGLVTIASDFPELTVGVLAMVGKIALMGRYLLTGCGIANSDTKRNTSYKHAFFSGPVTTDMGSVIFATNYGTIAGEVPADAMGYISNLRGLLMKNGHWNEAVAKSMWLYGIDGTPFVFADYMAHFTVHALPGYLHMHVVVKYVHTHNAYIRKAGTVTWDAPIRFDGPNFDVHRIPVSSPEDLEIMFKGIENNVESPLFSAIVKVTYTAGT